MALINAQNIHRSFGEDEVITHVLKGIDMTVEDGEFVAIMGRSGAGKSTLMYQLSVLDHPTKGVVEINGMNVAKLSEQEQTQFRLKTLGYVFQDYALVPDLNALENIMVPLLMKGMPWDQARLTAQEALDAVNIPEKDTNLPSQLSGGEQQRAAVARAIAGNPHIIFADEPTANLDSISGNAIVDLLGELNKKGQTIVMVTHEDEYTRYCNRIITIEDGRIIEERNLAK